MKNKKVGRSFFCVSSEEAVAASGKKEEEEKKGTKASRRESLGPLEVRGESQDYSDKAFQTEELAQARN